MVKTTKSIPLGIRNNNPLNIVYSKKNNWHGQLKGAKGRFTAFEDMMWGFRAAACLLRKYINVYKCNTIAQIVAKWAPASENNTTAYINFVCKQTGLKDSQEVKFGDTTVMLRVMGAMCAMENGNEYNPSNNPSIWDAMYKGYIMARENSTDFASINDPQVDDKQSNL